MATFTITTSKTLEQVFTDNPTMVSGDDLIISNGAVVTCTQTPTVLVGNITIAKGEFKIDGVNIASGNSIAFLGEWAHAFTAQAPGTVTIEGDWFSAGTTNGTDDQVIDLGSTGVNYFNGDVFVDSIPMIQIETGRRIDFDNAVGTAPEVDDFVFKTSDPDNVYGQIVEVQATYIVVRYLIGSLADNDAIEVRKVMDNVGPELQRSWTANVNNVSGDIKEAGVYQSFGNAVRYGVSHIANFGHHVGGFVFEHFHQATTLKLGTSLGTLGGFVPPSGCDIRIPNVYMASSNLTNFPLNQTYFTGTSQSLYYNFVGTQGGSFSASVCNIGTMMLYAFTCGAYSLTDVGFFQIAGVSACASKPTYTRVVNCGQTAWSSGMAHQQNPFQVEDNVNGADLTECLVISCGTTNVFRSVTSIGVTVKNCISSAIREGGVSNTMMCYQFATSEDITITGCIGVLADHSQADHCYEFNTCRNVTMRNNAAIHTQATGFPAASTGASHTASIINTCSDFYIENLFHLHGAYAPGDLVRTTDINNFRFRASGFEDDPVQCGVNLVDLTGIAKNSNVARVWGEVDATSVPILLSGTASGITLENVASGYGGEIDPRGINNRYKGIRAAGGQLGSGTGLEDDSTGHLDNHFLDFFRSDTTGAFGFLFQAYTAGQTHLTIDAGAPQFEGNGELNMVLNDQCTIEMDYFAKGHTGIVTSGGKVYTANSGGTSPDGTDDWVGTVDIHVQYDTGSGWNGTWLNLRTPADVAVLTGLTGIETGIKFKARFTGTGTENAMTGLLLHTSTSLATQAANLYPVDQPVANFRFEASVVGASIVVQNDTPATIFTLEQTTLPQYQEYSGFTLNDPATVTHMLFGYLWGQTTVGMIDGEVLTFLVQDTNPYIVETNTTTLAGWENDKITIDFTDPDAPIVTLNNATAQETYDFFQWWQAKPENSYYLPGGEIYSTTDGISFTARSDWTFVQSSIDTIYVVFSTGAYGVDDVVPGSNGTQHYSAVFTDIATMKADPTYGAGGTAFTGKHASYEFTNEQHWTMAGTFDTNDWTTASNQTVTFKPVEGMEHGLVWGNGARINHTVGYSYFRMRPFFTILRMEFEHIESNGAIEMNGGYSDGCIWKAPLSGNIRGGGTMVNSVVVNGMYTDTNGVMNCYNNLILGNLDLGGNSPSVCYWKNNIIEDATLDTSIPANMTVSNNAFTVAVGSVPADWQGAGDEYGVVIDDELVDLTNFDYHLKNASTLVGKGADVSGEANAPTEDAEGNPWLDDVGAPYYNIGPDMLGDVQFASVVTLSSTDVGAAYNVQDKDNADFASGILSVNPTVLGTPILATSLTDPIYLYHLAYGFKYKAATFVVTEGGTLLFLARETNTITVLSEVAAGALTGIAVDKVLKTVTVSLARTQSEVYDYLQWYQAQSANTDLLPDGEIFSTVQGNTYTILTGWKFIFTALPSGSWNVQGGSVQLGAVLNLNDFDHAGTILFDVAGSYTFTDCTIGTVDTVDANETVDITPSGSTAITTNADPTNITINTPIPTLTITGHPVGATVLIHDLDDADPQNLGTELARFETAAASVQYQGANGNLVSISMYEPGYKAFYQEYTIGATDATFTIIPDLETN